MRAAGIALLAVGLAVLCIRPPSPSAGAQGCPHAYARARAGNLAAVERAILCLVDRIRRAHGLRALHADRALALVARHVAAGMVRQNYFADVAPSGRTPLSLIASSGYQGRARGLATGQNVAWGNGSDTTAAYTVAAWMASPPHRANILSPTFHDAGVAVSAALPPALGAGSAGAIFAFEFAARL